VVVTVYIECEMAEGLEDVVADEEGEKKAGPDYLDPMEIHL
jgi:hypothetical protein